jgi:DNA-binding transcriptional MerR regulator
MRSGELAKRGGVSVDTLRHYEKKGLLAPPHRRDNGYREYPASALQRVRLIQRALDMGFSLDDLARVLRQRDAGGAPCHAVRTIAVKRLAELEARIASLEELRIELQTVVAEWDTRLASLPPGQRAGLLDALAATESRVESRREALAPVGRPRRRRRTAHRTSAVVPSAG